MKSITTKEIQDLDRIAINKIGIPSVVLMENAGRAVADQVLSLLKQSGGKKVVVLCGTGNNGGDGFVVARHLMESAMQVKTYCVGKLEKLKPDAKVYAHVLAKLKNPIKEVEKCHAPFKKAVREADVVVDAMFGVGLTRNVQSPYAGVIACINEEAGCVVAVDVPSGLDATTGKVCGCCVFADCTVTFTFPKKGFDKAQGPACVGHLVVADIGIPSGLLKKH